MSEFTVGCNNCIEKEMGENDATYAAAAELGKSRWTVHD